jgi:hypothetical protein
MIGLVDSNAFVQGFGPCTYIYIETKSKRFRLLHQHDFFASVVILFIFSLGRLLGPLLA